jgi:hypothetical protein
MILKVVFFKLTVIVDLKKKIFILIHQLVLTSTRRKIDALHELIHQTKLELDIFLIHDLNTEPIVLSKHSQK